MDDSCWVCPNLSCSRVYDSCQSFLVVVLIVCFAVELFVKGFPVFLVVLPCFELGLLDGDVVVLPPYAPGFLFEFLQLFQFALSFCWVCGIPDCLLALSHPSAEVLHSLVKGPGEVVCVCGVGGGLLEACEEFLLSPLEHVAVLCSSVL